MSRHTPGDWVVPVANIFRVLAVDEDGKPTRLIHDQPDMVSYFGDVRLEWKEDDGPEAAANARLIAASKKLLAACQAMLATWGSDDEDAIIKARSMAEAAVRQATHIRLARVATS